MVFQYITSEYCFHWRSKMKWYSIFFTSPLLPTYRNQVRTIYKHSRCNDQTRNSLLYYDIRDSLSARSFQVLGSKFYCTRKTMIQTYVHCPV